MVGAHAAPIKMKMASVKKNRPSNAKGTPNASPHFP
jgi:hypothetical protein